MTLSHATPAAPATAESVEINYDKVLEHLRLNPKDPKTQALMLACQRYDLDPVLKHAQIVDGDVYVTHKGLLHIAHRSGVFDGIEVLDQGETDTHHTAKVAVHRKDMGRPIVFPGRYPVLRGVYEWQDGPNGKRVKVKVGEELHPYGPEMAIKTAECMALRRAFDVAISVVEERWDLDDAPVTSVQRTEKPEAAASPSPAAASGASTTVEAASTVDPAPAAAEANGGATPPPGDDVPDWLVDVLEEIDRTPSQARAILVRHGFGILKHADWQAKLHEIAAGDRARAIEILRARANGGES